MKKRLNLLENEVVNFEIKKKRIFPFFISDLMYVFMIIIFLVIFQTIGFNNITDFSSDTIFKIIPVSLLIFFIIMCLNQFYYRYINVFKWEIILTNFRLIAIDQKEYLIKEFYLDNLPKISYEENAYNNGTLIIGETVKTKTYPYRGYDSYSFDLYNIKDVKSIYYQIKKLASN